MKKMRICVKGVEYGPQKLEKLLDGLLAKVIKPAAPAAKPGGLHKSGKGAGH